MPEFKLPYSHSIISDALSPFGKSLCIWLAGCPRRCPGCETPELQVAMQPNDCFEKIDMYHNFIFSDECQSIVVSGGEPLGFRGCGEQRRELDKLFDWIREGRARKGLRTIVILYTGYTYREVLELKEGQNVLDHISVLIDSPYVEEYNDDVPYRGSSNQNIIFLDNINV